MCGKGGGDTTQTTVTQLPPEMRAAYSSLINQAQGIYNNTSYTPFSGGVTNPTIDQSTQTLMNAQTAAQPYFSQANSSLAAASTPAYQSVQDYMNPYQSDVVNATMANLNETNAQQRQGVVGNAIMSGAMGGDRVGVAQAELARQQNLTNNQTLSQLNSQNYSQALSAAQQQQQQQLGIAQAQTGLGSAATTAGVQSGLAGTQAGEDAYNRALSQYQSEQSYPFQKASWLGSIVEGLGSSSGGTSTTTSNAGSGNTGSSILGGALGLGALLLSDRRAKEDIEPIGKTFDGQTMYRFRYKGDPTTHVGLIAQEVEKHHPHAVKTIDAMKGVDYHEATDEAAKRKHFATGGVVPYSDIQPFGGTQSGGINSGLSGGIIPNVGSMGTGSGPRPASATAAASKPDALSQLSNTLQQKALSKGLDKVGAPAPNTANPTAPDILSPPTSLMRPASGATAGAGTDAGAGILSALGSFLPFAKGGVVRNYDGGGVVDGTQVFDPEIGWIPLADTAQAPVGGVVPASPATIHAAVPPPAAAKDSTGQDIPPGYHEENGTILADAPAPSQGVAPAASAVAPQGGVVPAMPAPVWVPAEPKVNSRAALGGDYSTIDQQQEQQYGLPPGYLGRTGQIESGNDPSAHNRSGAAGRFQFMPATAASVGLQNPYDPVQSTEAAAKLASDNQAVLAKALGRQPTAAELYLAHQQGAGGAVSLLTHPDQPAASLIGEASVVQNGGDPRMTGQQFANMWVNKYNGAPADTTGSIGSSGVAPAPTNDATASPSGSGGILGSIQSALGGSSALSPDMRMALLSAGLGMMAGKSRNPWINIGEGGLAGVQNYVTSQDRNRANALAQSEIQTRQGNLGLEGKRVDQAAQQLQQQAEQFQKSYGLKANEQQMQRYSQTVTPAGIMVRDLLAPDQPPKLISWAQVQAGGASSPATQPAISGAASAAGAPQGGILPSASAPKPEADTSAVAPQAANTPASAQQAPAEAPSIFQTKAPNPTTFNPMVFSPVGQKVVESQATDAFKQATTDAASARDANLQLTEMKRDLATLPATGMLAPGNGFNSRLSIASSINTALQGLGFAPWQPEEQVAAGQDLNKLTTRLGFDLAKSLGSREAGFIVTQAVGAVPGGANSAAGAQRIIGGIQAANQRKIDYNPFLTDWAQKNGGDTTGAADTFNKMNPPELYALAAYVPPQAIQLLRQKPDMAPMFDKTYGAGTSKYALGSQ